MAPPSWRSVSLCSPGSVVQSSVGFRLAVVAGGVSGVTGTAAAIGGPFMAMVLQHEAPTRLRSTLAVFFTAGSILVLA